MVFAMSFAMKERARHTHLVKARAKIDKKYK